MELVSRRGVVFLRNQNVTPVQLTEFTDRLSRLAGSVRKPFL